jgi:predicted enzyme related to lactoylglutathione lyase
VGARARARTEIGNGTGAFAIFTDPVGNEFGLYEQA